jgi:hypothetical protein
MEVAIALSGRYEAVWKSNCEDHMQKASVDVDRRSPLCITRHLWVFTQ